MKERYNELDSLRGVAALAVFFGHMYLIFNENLVSKLLFEYGILRFTVAGSEAVVLFFVLSGFVLSLPYYYGENLSYGNYLIKRICRIYLPYISAIGLAYLLRELSYNGEVSGLSQWFNVNWLHELNTATFMEHLLLIRTFTSNLNNVVWSLVHEMRISLIFPFVVFILIKLNFKQSIIISLILSASTIIYKYVTNVSFIGTEVYVTIHYLSLFILGGILARFRDEIKTLLPKLSKPIKTVTFILGVILFLYAHPSFILSILINDFNPYYRTVIDSWFIALGASILISFSISNGNFSALLRNKLAIYLGKISYSLYLCHLAILFSMIHFFYKILPIWTICILTILITFTVATLMHHIVEVPSIKLGKRLTAKETKEQFKTSA